MRCHRALALAGALSILWSCGSTTPAGRARPTAVPWVPQQSPTDVSLRGLSVVSATVAWASGEHGTWLRTVDGGATWALGTVPGAADRDLRDIEALDRDTAIVMAVGSPGQIWRTPDGGESWTLVHQDDRADVFFDGLAFADSRRGYAFSDPVDGEFVAITTADGGLTWSPLTGLPAPRGAEAGFAASGTSIAAHGQRVWIGSGGAIARVFRSDDGGRTWSASAVPLRSGAPSRGVFSLAFRDLANGVAVGGDYLEQDVGTQSAAITADGGRTWHVAPGHPPSGYRSAVAHLPEVASPTFFAVGPNGVDATLDGGMSWSRVTDRGFHAVAFARVEPIGWAVGSGGRIARYDATLPLPADRRSEASTTTPDANPAPMTKIDYSTHVTTLAGHDTDLTEWRGKVLLVVNTASQCGFTPQLAGLEELHQRFQDRGFAVLGFPCNQFGGQEPGTADEIGEFCRRNYGVTFPVFAKIEVNGESAHPLFVQLREGAPGILGSTAIKWNFTKFLVGPDGEVVTRFAPQTKPDAIAPRIEELLRD